AAFYGGLAGFALVSVVVYWVREYILYVVKAGHIAVMVHLVDGRDVPDGQNQIAYARKIVTQRFAEANILFVVDQLVKGAIRAATRLTGGISALLPIPGLEGLVRFINTVIRDRKSTRLNSSHVKSSYAVFCLKQTTRLC